MVPAMPLKMLTEVAKACLAKRVPVLERIDDFHENRPVVGRLRGAESDVSPFVFNDFQGCGTYLTRGWGG